MEETKTPAPYQQSDENRGMSQRTKIGIGIGVVLAVLILVLVLGFLLNNPTVTQTVRDLFIILLALESLVVGTLLVILVYQLIALIQLLRDDLRPMIESVQETLNTVKGTTTFVSERVAKPAITASGYIAGIGRAVGVLISMRPRRRPQPTNRGGDEHQQTLENSSLEESDK
jgi:hypothetical protein